MDTSSEPNDSKNMSSKARFTVRVICILTAIMILLPFVLVWLTGAIQF
jgi:hypothetical protein